MINNVPRLLIATTILCFQVLNSQSLHAASFDQKHTLWDELVQAHVRDKGSFSQVDYKAIIAEKAKLNRYLNSISNIPRADFNRWSRDQRLAFLINAYNAFTVKLIVDHYPVKSIKDIGSLFTNSWKKKFFKLFGQQTHLDYIEHDLIRGNSEFSEPRIHFAVVCASIGCPKLPAKAFTANNLETLLESGTIAFLSDTSRNRYVANKRKLQLSKIFDWYGKDFVPKYGSVQSFVAKYVTQDPAEQALITNKKVSLGFLDYDWSLNDI